MTIRIYRLHSETASLCYEAHEAVVKPDFLSKMECVGLLAIARISSFVSMAHALSNTIQKFFVHVIKIIAIPTVGNFSADSLLRTAIVVTLRATLAILRFAISLGGIISPELVFGVFKMHKALLHLGLLCRAQEINLDWDITNIRNMFPQNFFTSEIDDQRWRRNSVSFAEETIERQEQFGSDDGWWNFAEETWRPAIHSALREELGLAVQAFFAPVPVSHPVLEDFQNEFSKSIHAAALDLQKKGMYTKDEIEDLVTALPYVVNCAVCKSVLSSFAVHEEDLAVASRNILVQDYVLENGNTARVKQVLVAGGKMMMVHEEDLGNGRTLRTYIKQPHGRLVSSHERTLQEAEKVCVDMITLKDGRALEGRDCGGLEEWKDLLLEVFCLLQSMTTVEQDNLLYYLCADDARASRARKAHDLRELPILELELKKIAQDEAAERLSGLTPDEKTVQVRKRLRCMDRCFKLIGDFSTTFISHHMPASDVLLKAFDLSEIS